jgi:hypothetical protein
VRIEIKPEHKDEMLALGRETIASLRANGATDADLDRMSQAAPDVEIVFLEDL